MTLAIHGLMMPPFRGVSVRMVAVFKHENAAKGFWDIVRPLLKACETHELWNSQALRSGLTMSYLVLIEINFKIAVA